MAIHQSSRLRRLEERHAPTEHLSRWHRVIGRSQSELNARATEMIASGQAAASDNFVYRLIVSPEPR